MIFEATNEWNEISSWAVKDRQPVERVKPLQIGEVAPVITIGQRDGYWVTPVSVLELFNPKSQPSQLLLSRPIVVGFYCPCWGSYAQPFLNTLIDLYKVIQRAGSRLIVFTNEHPRYLPTAARQIEITFIYDEHKTVARQFGVYSEADPIWDRISGISEEVYVPALYGIDANGEIGYRFLDEHFDGFADTSRLHDFLFQ